MRVNIIKCKISHLSSKNAISRPHSVCKTTSLCQKAYFCNMSESVFHFQQFSVHQDKCAMKVGSDSVILGAWADITTGKDILDIGTGTGLLALMAAQRNPSASITAVEIDPDAACQAKQNVSASPWSGRIEVVQADIRYYHCGHKFDAILCNPPYFSKSLRSPKGQRNIARHDETLDFADLSDAAARLLSESGKFFLIVPYDSLSEITGAAAISGLQLQECILVHTRPCKNPKRVLLSFGHKYQEAHRTALHIADETQAETMEYIELVKDFYLKYKT